MFGIGTQEILVILLVVLLLFGGKRIPELARIMGKGMGDFRRAARDVQREIDLEILDERGSGDTGRNKASATGSSDGESKGGGKVNGAPGR